MLLRLLRAAGLVVVAVLLNEIEHFLHGVHIELVVDVRDMRLGRMGGYGVGLLDVIGVAPLRYEHEYLGLARR